MLGLEPTQMEQLRKREGLRLVVEERLVEAKDVCVALVEVASYFSKVALSLVSLAKEHAVILLCTVIVLAIMFL